MRVLFIDMPAGIAGDMLVGALLELGADLGQIERTIAGLDLGEIRLEAKQVMRGAFAATKFEPIVPTEQPHRTWKSIEAKLLAAKLPERVHKRAWAVFDRLAGAEAEIHGVAKADVHFHEIGAADSIADIVGACAALEQLHVDKVIAGPVPLGSGAIESAHGMMPLPAPATTRLLTGWPVRAAAGPGEWVTPTGAALLAALAEPGVLPTMTLLGVGHGAGSKTGRAVPNLLRAFLGTTPNETTGLGHDTIDVLECQLDDLTGELFPDLIRALFDAGAIDAFGTSILMKKGRPGLLVTALVPPERAQNVAQVMLSHSSSLGLRHRSTRRWLLPRELVTVSTVYGDLRVKKALPPEGPPRWTPEHDDCAAAAKRSGVPIAEVYRAALVAASAEA